MYIYHNANPLGKHVVAVIDGNYYDTWDSGNEYAVFYWKLEG